MADCIALDWKRTPEGMDYVRCDGTDAVECRIEGILHTFDDMPLCRAHMDAFYKMGADVIPKVSPKWMEKASPFQRTSFVHWKGHAE